MKLADAYCLRPGANLNAAVAGRENPLQVFARLSIAEHYESEWAGENELHITLPGLWCHHDLILTWDKNSEAISLFLAFDGRAPGGRSDDICRLISLRRVSVRSASNL